MDNDSRLIIIRGNSGSGKSTAARELQMRLGRNTLIISQDIVRRQMLYVRDGQDTPALSLLADLLNYGHSHCRHVILEGILYADWYEPLFKQAVNIFGNRIYAYYYDLSFKETLKRHATRKERSDFGEQEMRQWWRNRDYLKIISEKIFKAEITLDDAVDIIMKDLSN